MNHVVSLIAACVAAGAALASVYFAVKTGQYRRKAEGHLRRSQSAPASRRRQGREPQ